MANAIGKSNKLFLFLGIALILSLSIPLCKRLLRERQQRITYETFCVKNPKDLANVELVHSLTNNCPDWKHRGELWTELLTRKDDEIDLLLRKFFEEMQQPRNWGWSRLDSFAGKRPGSYAERILPAIGRRGGERNIQFILSLTNSPYVVIRGSIARVLAGNNVREKPENEEALWKLTPLIHDPDPDVAERTLYTMAGIDSFRESQIFLAELLKAERAAVPNANLTFGGPWKFRLHQEVEEIYHLFSMAQDEHRSKGNWESNYGTESRAKSEMKEFERIDSLLHFIDENRKFKTVSSNDVVRMPNDELNAVYKDAMTNGAAWRYESYALATNEFFTRRKIGKAK